MRKIFDKKNWQPAVVILLLIFLIIGGLIINWHRIQQARGGASHNVHGWLYSENMGWLNTNCYNDYNNDNIFECCCPTPNNIYCPSGAVACPAEQVPGGGAVGDYGVNADIDSVTFSNVVNGYAWAENYADWSNATTIADASRGYICFGATCNGIPPNGIVAAWACVGIIRAKGTCLGDCGQEFNYQETCTQPYTVVDSALVGHWTLDDVRISAGDVYKTLDTSGNGLDATVGPIYPTLAPLLVTGNFKQETTFTAALSYDTDADPSTVNRVYAEVSDTLTLGLTQNFTLEGWVNLKGAPTYNHSQIMLRKDGAYALGVIPSTYDKFAAELYIGGGWQTYYFSDADFANNYVDKWRHVALTYDDGHYVRLYLDGVLDRIYAQLGPVNIAAIPLPLYLGGERVGPLPGGIRPSIAPNASYLDGYLDNVAIYSRVKTAEELWQDAHKEVTGWARIKTADSDDGWISLHGSVSVNYEIYIPNIETFSGSIVSENQMWGVYLNDYSQGGGFYTLGGRYSSEDPHYEWRTWAWGSDDSLGWATGSHAFGIKLPGLFDSFNAVNINPINGKIATQLNWAASKGATYYIFYRCTGNGCNPTLPYPVPYYACEGEQCSINDDNNGFGLEEGTWYCYTMQAWNWDGSRMATNNPPTYPQPYCILTLPPPLSSDVLVNGNVCGQLQTIWNPSSDEEATVDGYNLYRGLNNTPDVGCNHLLTDPKCLLVAHAGEGVKASDLSAQWRMNEASWSGQGNEVVDASGNQNNGTASASGATTTATNAKFIRSGIFSGGYVSSTDSSTLDFTADDSFTIAGWVRTTATSGSLIYKYVKPNGSGYEVLLSGGYPVCHVIKNPGQNILLTWSGVPINDGGWHYIACVGSRSNNLLKIFVDNNFDSSTADISTLGDISNGYDLIIGEDFSGMLDNWSIVKAARTHTELLLEAESRPLISVPPSPTDACNTTTTPSFVYGSGQGALTCGPSDKCCSIIDRRGNPNTTYYYWLTQTAGAGESSAKAPSANCQSAGATYRYGCDKTVCQPRVNTKEK